MTSTKSTTAEAAAKQAAVAISHLKVVLATKEHPEDQGLSYDRFKKELHKNGAPYTGAIVPVLIKEKLIEKKDNKYFFTPMATEPIPFTLFTEALDHASKMARTAGERKRKANPEEELQKMIQLLKSKGYKVLQPFTDYREI